jgi:antitoxin CptB
VAQPSRPLYIGPPMDELRLKKLKYRAEHRGFREADIIIGGFAEKHMRALSPAQLDEFERLIDQPDQDLYAWIIGKEPTPEAFDGEVMDLIRTFRFFAHTMIGADRGA